MPLYQVAAKGLVKVAETTFADEKVLEQELQRLLKADISVLGEDLMVVVEEFGDWEDSSRRIDLLCLDREAKLVVVELKRTEDGGHMELQALRYAAMVSPMTVEQLVAAHARHLGGDDAGKRAEAALVGFLGWEALSEGTLTGEIRIILASADFSVELTTSVLWLNNRGLDITCVQLKPYRLGEQLLIDAHQVIPLPEAAEYETQLRVQQQEARRAESGRQTLFSRFWAQMVERSRSRTQVLAGRRTATSAWITGRSGRPGFNLNFVLKQDEGRVECYIDLPDGADANLAAFRALFAQRATIEKAYGGLIEWQELEDSRACRICVATTGGWKTPESEWPALQERMIEAMVRFEKAMKPAILAVQLPGQ